MVKAIELELRAIQNHIIEASRAGMTRCWYEVDSEVDMNHILSEVQELRKVGYKIGHENRILSIDWSEIS